MKQVLRSRVLALAAAATVAICAQGSANAALIFSDNFDGEPHPSTLNFASFANWTVSNGTVDLIDHGGFSLSCAGGAGTCVDLDGSTSDAGRLSSTTQFNLAAGDYVLSFTISGNQRGGNPDVMNFGFGTALIEVGFTRDPTDPFTNVTRNFTVGAAGALGNVFFEHLGSGADPFTSGDNFGMILDNVVLESRDVTPPPNGAVPEPGSMFLLGTGLLALGALRRRAQRQ